MAKNAEANFRSGLIPFLGAILFLLATTGTGLTKSRIDDDDECRRVAKLASQQTGVPESVLYAISLAETGRKKNNRFGPWPWTVNMEGRGVWFDTAAAARAFVDKEYQRGARSFDVGCFQLNYKWHGRGFSSIEEMFDPMENAIYAANFLRELHQEMGNWSDAAGAYHSRTPKYANKYKARFNTIHAKLSSQNFQAGRVAAKDETRSTSQVQTNTVNGFPLLQGSSSAQTRMGSLFPGSDSETSTPLVNGG